MVGKLRAAHSTYKHLENGLDLTEDEHYDLGQLDHQKPYGFRHYVFQATRGLARGPSGQHYQHRFGARYIYDLYMHLVLNPEYTDKGVDYPNGFVPVKVYEQPYYDVDNLLYVPEEGEGNFIQKNKLHNQCLLHFCAIYEIVAPTYLGSDKCVFQIIKANYLHNFTEGDAARCPLLVGARVSMPLLPTSVMFEGVVEVDHRMPSPQYAQPA